jgi:hypothetical protein
VRGRVCAVSPSHPQNRCLRVCHWRASRQATLDARMIACSWAVCQHRCACRSSHKEPTCSCRSVARSAKPSVCSRSALSSPGPTTRSTGRAFGAPVSLSVRRQVPRCPNCQTELAVPYSLSGEFKCPSCGELLQSNVPPLLVGAIVLWVPLAVTFASFGGLVFCVLLGGPIAFAFWIVIVLCCRVRLSSSSAERDA